MIPEQIMAARAELDLFKCRRKSFHGILSELDTDRLMELCRQALTDVERLEAENAALRTHVRLLQERGTPWKETALRYVKENGTLREKVERLEKELAVWSNLGDGTSNVTVQPIDAALSQHPGERFGSEQESKPASGSSEEADHSFRSNAATPVQPQDWRRSAGGDAPAAPDLAAPDLAEENRRLRAELEGTQVTLQAVTEERGLLVADLEEAVGILSRFAACKGTCRCAAHSRADVARAAAIVEKRRRQQ